MIAKASNYKPGDLFEGKIRRNWVLRALLFNALTIFTDYQGCQDENIGFIEQIHKPCLNPVFRLEEWLNSTRSQWSACLVM